MSIMMVMTMIMVMAMMSVASLSIGIESTKKYSYNSHNSRNLQKCFFHNYSPVNCC